MRMFWSNQIVRHIKHRMFTQISCSEFLLNLTLILSSLPLRFMYSKIFLICILLYAITICTLCSIGLIYFSNTSLIHLFFVSLLLMWKVNFPSVGWNKVCVYVMLLMLWSFPPFLRENAASLPSVTAQWWISLLWGGETCEGFYRHLWPRAAGSDWNNTNEDANNRNELPLNGVPALEMWWGVSCSGRRAGRIGTHSEELMLSVTAVGSK